jgi:hypothetical protein
MVILVYVFSTTIFKVTKAHKISSTEEVKGENSQT